MKPALVIALIISLGLNIFQYYDTQQERAKVNHHIRLLRFTVDYGLIFKDYIEGCYDYDSLRILHEQAGVGIDSALENWPK